MASERQITVPDIGDFHDVEVIEVLVAVGDRVKADQTLITLESEKATMEIPSPAAGVVKSLAVGLGDKLNQGSLIATPETVVEIPAWPVQRVVDVTGAGDLYAAGFLFGYTQGRDYADCGRIASIAAAEIISHFGARPETPLSELLLQQLI